MKKILNTLKFAAILLLLAGVMISCEKKDTDDMPLKHPKYAFCSTVTALQNWYIIKYIRQQKNR
ncbi:MAG: hypothetical protein LBS43_01195 [Prevotellaceae bacterium]|jgi:hypothetical protein|nr:hypothetical protein [Prevotellaceae bacterium]